MIQMRITRVDVINAIGEVVTIREGVDGVDGSIKHPDRLIVVEVGGEFKDMFILRAPAYGIDHKEFSRAVEPAYGLDYEEVIALSRLIGISPGVLTHIPLDEVNTEQYPDPRAK